MAMPELGTQGGVSKKVTSDVYWVSLTAKGVKHFPFADFPSHRSARKFMIKYAQILDLPCEDHFQKRKEAAFITRQKVEARRRK